jgi:hypothetical protein
MMRHVNEAPPQDDPRDEIARIIDPYSWKLRERALNPYREGRGSFDLENWLYQTTYAKGFRTVEEVDAWLRDGTPLFEDHTETFHSAFQDSIRRADAILKMLGERGMTK